MKNKKLSLSILPHRLAVCRLDKDARLPAWATRGAFFSVNKTPDELSIVCSSDSVPDGVKAEKGWRAVKVEGPLDLSLSGIFASLSAPLSKAKISIFAVSTFDTDYLLVKDIKLKAAAKILSEFCAVRY